jgi:rSAM/selenodomain-associated transferase 2/rSAM/selenodomain-associated transferase 1
MADRVLVSVIIPVWRDEDALTRTLERLSSSEAVEIVACGVLGDTSRFQPVRTRRPAVHWVAAPRGRASQMNAGAAIARGRWLLFLHADTELPPDWLDVIARADASPRIVGGAFRFALDSRDWRARVIEGGVRLRVALFGMPYGDQALFVRRRTFEALGGYHDLPLMEDIDFVRRLKGAGQLLHARSQVRTSARRWERDGWAWRTVVNVSLALRYLLGASPARLAQRYLGREALAVVMMARAPWSGGKTRLAPALSEGAHAALRHALALDTLDVVTSLPDVQHIVACEPADACEPMRALVGPQVDVLAQRGDDLGQRLRHVFEDVFRLGAESVVVIGSDLPDLPVRVLHDAMAALRARTDRVVIGPAADGGYYLIGMSQSHPALFDRIEWSTDRVLQQTIEAAKAQNLEPLLLEEWVDVDDLRGLQAVVRRPSESGAARTRAWALEHPSTDEPAG